MTQAARRVERLLKMEVFRKTIWVGFKPSFEYKFGCLNKVLKRMHKPMMSFSYENERLVKHVFTTHVAGESHLTDKSRFARFSFAMLSSTARRLSRRTIRATTTLAL